jgi:hypothetical protein
MPVCRFSVVKVALEPNVRGQRMRRVELRAVVSDAFVSADRLPDGMSAPDPDGFITLLVNPKFAEKFQLGDEFDVPFRETVGE